LLKLKDGTRGVSPRTLDFVDPLLSQRNTASSEDFKTEYLEEVIEGLQKIIPFLEARLETDDKYTEELASFTALGHENVLLKYGDYCAEAVIDQSIAAHVARAIACTISLCSRSVYSLSLLPMHMPLLMTRP
jgi:hypothetical protein